MNVPASANKTLVHVFRSIPLGATYEITVSTNVPNAQPVSTFAYSHPLPAPSRLKVYLGLNGSYVVSWKTVNEFKDVP